MTFPQNDQRRMVERMEELGSPEGAWPCAIPGVLLLRTTRSTPPVPVLYEPCIAIVAQGRKRFHMPGRVLSYDARNYLMLTVPTPACCETLADEGEPFLGIAVRIDLGLLSDLLATLEGKAPAQRSSGHDTFISAPAMTDSLRDVALRLLESLRSPADAAVLGPQLVRELTYRVLCGAEGGSLRDLLLANGSRTQIHRILHRMHTRFESELNVSSLAREAGMSVSALHLHFKAVTGTSPVQYLKMIRLHKARMLMAQDTMGASVAAEQVGYHSASQFSREFKRFFGAPPADEAQRVRAAFGL